MTILRDVVGRVGRRPLAVCAVLLVALEALLAALGAGAPWLTLAALLLAPGLALAPLLPARVRGSPVAVLASAPMLGFAATAVLIVSLSSSGVALDGLLLPHS
jgi:hypothetical protein